MYTSKTLPKAHKCLLQKIISFFSQDNRVLGIAASGSYAIDAMDRYSDLDLVIAIDPVTYNAVMESRLDLVSQVDGYITAFTGEHVGEPRLIIALYGPELIHVDFKFVDLPSAGQRVDDAKVLWERRNSLTNVYQNTAYSYPQPDIQWIEDRFWVWVHYGATKIGRGEYFEALEFLSFLRTTVISPLALRQHQLTPSGVRNIEVRLPEFSANLKTTVATPDKVALSRAFRNTISLYLELRSNERVNINHFAQERCIEYFDNEAVQ